MVMGVLEVFALVLSSPKYCISDSFVDHDGFLPTVVDIRVI